MSGVWLTHLDCPACGNPCVEIPSCETAHRGCMAQSLCDAEHTWCEDRTGVCSCGAVLHVETDGERAWLEESEDVNE